MSSLTDFAKAHTSPDRVKIAHLNRLVSEWGMLADFCFADLLLYLRSNDGVWMTVGQVRPATGQTIFTTDYVGVPANESENIVLSECFESGEVIDGEVVVEGLDDESRMMAIPVSSMIRVA